MKTKTFAGFALKLALLYGIGIVACAGIQAQPTVPASTQPTPSGELRFRLVHDSIMVVPVASVSGMGNEGEPFDFILDTGAQTTVVDPIVAKRLSLVIQSQIRQITLTGTQTVPISGPTTLALGTARVAGLHVLIQSLDSLHQVDSRIVGILGQDFLSNFNYMVDYHARTIQFDQADTILHRINGDQVSFDKGGKRMVLTAQAQGRSAGHATLRLLLDSGATSLVLIGAGSSQIEPLMRGVALKTAFDTTSNGQAPLKTGEVGVLQIGTERFRDIRVAFSSRPAAEVTEDGLVPMAIFRSIYVNNRDSLVLLNPRMR